MLENGAKDIYAEGRFENYVDSVMFGKKTDTGQAYKSGKAKKEKFSSSIDKVRSKFGEGRTGSFVEKLKKINTYQELDSIGEITKVLLKAATKGSLAANMSVISKQLGSVYIAGSRLIGGSSAITKAMTDVGLSTKYSEEMLKHSDYFYHRKFKSAFSIEGAEILRGEILSEAFKRVGDVKGAKAKLKAVDQLWDQFMNGIQRADETAMNILWKASKDDLGLDDLSKATPEEIDALNQKFYDLIETQPSNIKRLKNAIQLSNDSVSRLLSQFTSPGARAYENTVSNILSGDKESVTKAVTGLALSAIYVTAVGTGFGELKREIILSQEDQDAVRAKYGPGKVAASTLVGTTLGTIPGLGPALNNIIMGAATGDAFRMESHLSRVANTATILSEGVNGMNDAKIGRAVQELLILAGTPSGLVKGTASALKAMFGD